MRARDLGVPFDGTPGRFNAITDVAGVEVGYKTLVSGEGKLIIVKGPVRTGVTAILPPEKLSTKSVFATPHDSATIPGFCPVLFTLQSGESVIYHPAERLGADLGAWRWLTVAEGNGG